MRYLNKIVFINSAHIRYEEVMLDGNVHFIGTQGVGKSTLLRALLFFYNANKLQLGIQMGQKNFDEFYFEKSNSYIVYEVMRENGAYSILVDRFQGRATYFFIDAPYDRNWLIEEDGNVLSEWVSIRSRIGRGIDVSGRIDTYEMYRNIIFGNTHDPKHRYDKYAIAESSKYQNIPRSIQNVFLNSKLDAEFVKNTIIQSMADSAEEEKGINLAAYRHQLEDFENEFNDISLWFQHDKDGNYPLRQQADRVVDAYRLIVAQEEEMRTLWRKLNYATSWCKQQLPKLESEKRDLQEKINRLKKQLDEIGDKYDNEREKLNRDLGALDGKLKDIAAKRKKYNDLNITEVLKLAGQEDSFLAEKQRLETIKSSLLKEYTDITEKYKRLIEELERSRKDYEQNQKQILSNKRDEYQSKKELFSKEEKSLLRQIDEKFSLLLKESDDRLNAIHNDKSRCDGLLRDLRSWHPKEQEIKECKESIIKTQTSEAELNAKHKATLNEIELMRANSQKEQNELDNAYRLKLKENQIQLDKYNEELSKVNDLLARYDLSLYQWLETNKPGWQENIGKVVDEERVLYNTELQPDIDENPTTSLFGVKIDLQKIPSSHRTPDEYKVLQTDLEGKVSLLKNQMSEDEQALDKSITEISKRFNAKTAQLNQDKIELEIQLNHLPQELRSLKTQLHKLEMEEQEIVAKESEVRQQALDAVLLKLEKETDARNKMNANKQREQKSVSRDIASKEALVKKDYDDFKAAIENDMANNAKAVEIQRKAYVQEQNDVLKGKGVDTSILERNQHEIDVVDAKLRQIKNQAGLVFEYRKDERELFNNEESFRIEKKNIEAKLDALKQKYQESKEKKEAESEELRKEFSKLNDQINQMREGLQEAERYCQIENDLPVSLVSDVKEVETKETCQVLLSSLRGCVGKIRNKREDLKKAVILFKSRFSSNNTFNFKTDLNNDEDYRDFSINLQEFLDNNLIEEYRRRTNVLYDDILKRVAKEVGYVMKGTSKIKEIISALNRDFKERNFAGVIKSIELRAEETSDRLMQMLLSIQKFTEENIFSMGEINLFSGDDRDEVNEKVIDLLVKLMKQLQKDLSRQYLGISDTFRLQFRIRENDNDTSWVERISNVGSDGTDILVKAMINIMLINVFKERASRKFGEFKVHCMMDEIGKLHPNNIKGILQFANSRNILLINSSPTTNNPYDYKYTYTLSKDANAQTRILLTLKKNEDVRI